MKTIIVSPSYYQMLLYKHENDLPADKTYWERNVKEANQRKRALKAKDVRIVDLTRGQEEQYV